jgi:hypothetical protein
MSDAVLGLVWSGGAAGRPGARTSGADSRGLSSFAHAIFSYSICEWTIYRLRMDYFVINFKRSVISLGAKFTVISFRSFIFSISNYTVNKVVFVSKVKISVELVTLPLYNDFSSSVLICKHKQSLVTLVYSISGSFFCWGWLTCHFPPCTIRFTALHRDVHTNLQKKKSSSPKTSCSAIVIHTNSQLFLFLLFCKRISVSFCSI